MRIDGKDLGGSPAVASDAVSRPAVDELESIYQRAANLSAKAALDPSNTTVAEHVELANLRAELRDIFGLVVP
jgi:hypothetical protein